MDLPMTTINLRVPDDILERINAEADLLGVTRTALLLRPFLTGAEVVAGGEPSPPPAQVEAKSVKPAPVNRGRIIGYHPITNEPLYR